MSDGMEITHNSEDKIFIYGLVDPNTEEIRYIGQARDPEKRFKQHLNDYAGLKKIQLIKELKEKDQIPTLQILCATDTARANVVEKFYIKEISKTTNLTNTTHLIEPFKMKRISLSLEQWKSLEFEAVDKDISTTTLINMVLSEFISRI